MTNDNDDKQTFHSFGFKMAIFGQTFKETIQNTLGRKQNTKTVNPLIDSQLEEDLKKVESLKKFIEESQHSIKKIIDSMTATIEAEQTLTLLFSEESCKEGKDTELKNCYIKCRDSFNRDSRELSKYITPLKNYENWLDTFLTKAIKDTEDTISLCNQARIEIQSYSSCLTDAKQRLKYETEGTLEQQNTKKIIEASEYRIEQSKAKFAQLKIQLKEKADVLELKCQIDLPNYLNAAHNAIRLYHQAALEAYAEPLPKMNSEASSAPTEPIDENISLK